MKQLVFALVVLLIGTPLWAQDVQTQGFETTDVGIYSREVQSSERDAQGVLQSVVTNPQLAIGTSTIPVKLGVTFGFKYKITGQPTDAVVTVRKLTRYPSPGARPPGAKKPLLVNSKSLDTSLNQFRFSSYTLEEPWELLPGKWVFEFWSGDRKLGEQEFKLVAQKPKPKPH